MNNKMYFNIICEEIEATGGKVIHIDENKSDLISIHKLVKENISKYPNAKWELYSMAVNIK